MDTTQWHHPKHWQVVRSLGINGTWGQHYQNFGSTLDAWNGFEKDAKEVSQKNKGWHISHDPATTWWGHMDQNCENSHLLGCDSFARSVWETDDGNAKQTGKENLFFPQSMAHRGWRTNLAPQKQNMETVCATMSFAWTSLHRLQIQGLDFNRWMFSWSANPKNLQQESKIFSELSCPIFTRREPFWSSHHCPS